MKKSINNICRALGAIVALRTYARNLFVFCRRTCTAFSYIFRLTLQKTFFFPLI